MTRYQYDPVGNITNVIDPFNGNTSFEYDRVGRRTKRTLPNGIVTTWDYNWKDQVTNILHKTSGGTLLASVLYERLAGGEPSKITREDGSYVTLQYDSALRLTNEVYYTNSAAQTTNSYGYDASGSRVRLVTSGVIYTNSVIAGYRVTQVKTNGNVVETYDYDSGGRVTNIARSGITLKMATTRPIKLLRSPTEQVGSRIGTTRMAGGLFRPTRRELCAGCWSRRRQEPTLNRRS